MIKIIHLADIHILNTERHDEYKKVFDKLYKILEAEKPNIICNLGDTFDLFVNISNEAKILAGSFLNNLTLYCDELIQVIGNHDIMKKNLKRVNSIETIVKLIDNPKIKYFDKSGFFNDEIYPITWVNHSHIQKKINPWTDIEHKKDKNRFYIDLFHDPVYGSKNDFGKTFDDPFYKKASSFKGDLTLLGDIHKYQVLDKKGRIAFSGSLIQQDAGENPCGHGVIKWELNSKEDIKHTFIEIKNDEFSIIKFVINPGADYDNLNLKTKHLANKNKFKIDWNEYAAFVNNENEQKIRKYISENFNSSDIEIKPNRIYTDIKDGKMLSEMMDINDKKVQQSIIKQYLKENKFSDEFIEKIIGIDNAINDRLHLSSHKNILWNIDKFWFNNFKSYGENNLIDWSSTKGTIQIAGLNQQGKTTILDAICFILYGTTASTTKVEKNGNNRYINKYNDTDWCDGGCVLDINGEKYIMYRRVDREYSKNGNIKSCPMTLDYYKGTEMNDETKQTGENKVQTQKLLDGVLGDFNDFIRMALTNADNLNSLLSMDKSVFIDSVIRDAGYDVFEKKLEEFKEYKKELNLEKIVLDEQKTENEIIIIKKNIFNNENDLDILNKDLLQTEGEIDDENKKKDDLLRLLHKIDDSVLEIDVLEIESNINHYKNKVEQINNNIKDIDIEIDLLPNEFNDNKFEIYLKNYDKITTEINNKNLEISDIKSSILLNNNKINRVDRDIEIEKNKYLDDLNIKISKLDIENKQKISNINNDFYAKKSKLDNKVYSLKKDINIVRSEGQKLKEEIESYENILNSENSICPTCNQPIVNKDDDHISSLISDRKLKLKELALNGKSKIDEVKNIEIVIEELIKENEKDLLEIEDIFNREIDVIKNKIDKFDLKDIKDKVTLILENKKSASLENELLKEKITEKNDFILKLGGEISELEEKIKKMKNQKSLFDKRKDVIHQKDVLISKLKDVEKEYKESEDLLEKYKLNEKLIKENSMINKSIEECVLKIDNLKYKSGEIVNNKLYHSNQITLYKRVVEELEGKLLSYRQQILLEEQHDAYLKLMHRTGLPTYLLLKNIDILNKELSDLLTNTDFTIFFDGDLNLRLKHDKLDGDISAIESSGMERTFSAISLKTVLRIINFKSKPNFIFIDECMNRLVDKSVDKFSELIETLKAKIDKIVIIEHNNEILSDLIINVSKNENGISNFEII